jgi:hypothetical protein
MVLSSDNNPFSIALGLDLTENEDFDFNKTSHWLSQLTTINIDYIVSNISIKDPKIRKNFCKNINQNLDNSEENKLGPILINDFQMKFHMWKNNFISKIHNEDLKNISENFDIITQDLNYANYINSKSSILEINLEDIFENKNKNKNFIGNNNKNVSDINAIIDIDINNTSSICILQNEFILVKLIKQFLSENIGRHLSISMNFTKKNFFYYTKLQNQISNVDNFEVLLKLGNELPDEVIIK